MITIKDVADHAGVSFKTVSRVINGVETVNEAMRVRVQDSIQKLGYRPNQSARELRGVGTNIALVYDNPKAHYIVGLQDGIIEACRKRAFELVIYPCNSKSRQLVKKLTDIGKSTSVAGLILTPPISENETLVRKLSDVGIAISRILSGDGSSPGVGGVYVDDRSASFALCQHLLTLGHKKIAFLAGDSRHSSTRERLEGY